MTVALKCYGLARKPPDLRNWRIADGVQFTVSDEARAVQSTLSRMLLKALGPVKGHYSDIDSEIWRFAAKLIQDGRNDVFASDVSDLLDLIAENANAEARLFKPCHSVVLSDGVDSIGIGPVIVRRSESVVGELARILRHAEIDISSDDEIEYSASQIRIPVFLWEIQISAANKVRDEQAAWLIDVALSLLRLCVKRRDLGINPPTLGKIEASPTRKDRGNKNSITVRPDGRYIVGGWSLPSLYKLGPIAQSALNDDSFQKRAYEVFAGKRNSLAERFCQGLGWMSRGRQSSDRPTRLLYFFTAIEALLSSDDKKAPVVQTISRHAAVLISDENELRYEISRSISKLYAIRSSLVHSGRRDVLDSDADEVQYIVEILFLTVWERVELTMAHSRFVQALAEASYGLPPKF